MNEQAQEQFIPIFLESLITNTVLNFNLYLYDRIQNSYVLYHPHQTGFSKKGRHLLIENGISLLFITAHERRQYQQYIETHLHQIVENVELRSDEKARIVYQAARDLMEEVMEGTLNGAMIDRVRDFIKNTVQYILKERNFFFNIISFVPHTYYTYTHSINVCIYALSLARRMDIHSPYKLANLGTGALLHDIGKKTISPEILLKKGKLTDEEWEIIKEHPQRGVGLIKKYQNLHSDILQVINYHHEKLDGSGYPDGLKERAIPLYAKIVCIADIFDALNTNRPYKEAADTFHSIEVMHKEFEGKIDKTIFHELVLLFKG
ncbi:MAG: HD domain-containing protein [Candidatus Omnitrophica bacterium]|nr:HD domain-containing protein [Candidatus Omnitrophota bacterium]